MEPGANKNGQFACCVEAAATVLRFPWRRFLEKEQAAQAVRQLPIVCSKDLNSNRTWKAFRGSIGGLNCEFPSLVADMWA